MAAPRAAQLSKQLGARRVGDDVDRWGASYYSPSVAVGGCAPVVLPVSYLCLIIRILLMYVNSHDII